MTKKILVSAFLALFGLAMTNITLANHEDVMCTQQYAPVCGEVQVQCIKAPCYPVKQTFGNACMAGAAHATNIKEGECDGTPYNRLANTAWKLQSFDGDVVTAKATLSFDSDKLSASVCNSKSASYEVSGSTLLVGPMMSTLMFCEGPLGTYETAFDLSGANYEFSTEGGNHLMITTDAGHQFQWMKVGADTPKPSTASQDRRYGFIFWQIHQIEKLKGYDTVEEKQAFIMSLIEKINDIMIRSSMTPSQNAAMMFLKNAFQYYYDYKIS